MTKHVHIPIRIVVDTDAVAHRQDDVDQALRRALGRALDNAYQTAVAPRGGYVDLQLHPPAFRWAGPAADLIDEDRRAAFQARADALIQQAIRASAIADHDQIGADAPLPLPADPAEPADRRRLHSAYGLYEIPRYDDDGDETAVEVEPAEESEEGTPVRGAWIGVWEWYDLSHSEIRADGGRGGLTDWGHFLYEQAVERFGEPASEWRGIIFRDGSNLILDFNNPTGDSPGSFTFLTIPVESFKQYVFRGRDETPPYERVIQLPYPGPTQLTKLGPYSAAQRHEVVREHMQEGIRERFEREFPNPNPRVISADEHRQTVQAMIDAEIERRVNDLPNEDFVIYLLRIGEYTHLVIEPATSAAGFDLPEPVHLVPITLVNLIQLGAGEEGEEGDEASGSGRGRQGGTRGGYGSGGRRGTGDGRGGADDGGQSGFVFTQEGGEGGTMMYPIVGGGLLALSAGCFEDEPKLEELGEDGQRLREEMQKIAYLLQIKEMDCAGRFAINAALVLGARAAAVGIYAGNEEGFTEPAGTGEGDSGNLGSIHFRPVVSPAIQFLRHLSSVVPDLDIYVTMLDGIYSKPEHAGKFGGHYTNNVNSWFLRFHYALNGHMEESVGGIFVRTCQVLLLQLLRSSEASIKGRLRNLGRYSQVFEQVILPQLRSVQELIDLRDTLQTNQRAVALSGTLRRVERAGAPVATDWAAASRMLLDTLVASNTAEPGETGQRGEIVVENGEVKIFDGSGRLWTLQGLEQAIQVKRGFVEGADPLVKQLADLEDGLARFEGDSVDIMWELLMLLTEMDNNNQSQQEETRSDAMHAFEMGQITENLEQRTIPYTTYALQGIHLMAHEMIGEFFRGDRWYAMGVEYIFDVVSGMRSLRNFLEFGAVILLSVVCPPLGTALGIGLSLYHYAEAAEKEELYESLIDPELVISRAQVEAEMFAAQLGLALSFIPEAGGIVARGLGVGARAGSRAAAELAEEGLEQGLRASRGGIRRAIVGRLSREAAESLKHGIMVAFAREIITDRVMDALVGKLMIEPIVQGLYREYMTIGPGLRGGGLVSPVAGDQAPAGDQPPASGAQETTDAAGNTITRHADGSLTITFRQQGADVEGED